MFDTFQGAANVIRPILVETSFCLDYCFFARGNSLGNQITCLIANKQNQKRMESDIVHILHLITAKHDLLFYCLGYYCSSHLIQRSLYTTNKRTMTLVYNHRPAYAHKSIMLKDFILVCDWFSALSLDVKCYSYVAALSCSHMVVLREFTSSATPTHSRNSAGWPWCLLHKRNLTNEIQQLLTTNAEKRIQSPLFIVSFRLQLRR